MLHEYFVIQMLDIQVAQWSYHTPDIAKVFIKPEIVNTIRGMILNYQKRKVLEIAKEGAATDDILAKCIHHVIHGFSGQTWFSTYYIVHFMQTKFYLL